MDLNARTVIFLLTILFLGLLAGFLLIPVPSFSGTLPGNLIGLAGTLLIGYTLVYSFRKRVLGKKGKQNPLNHHVIAGLTGASLIIIHSGHTYASLNGTLAFLAMVTIVLSGLGARFLLGKISRSLKNQKRDVAEMHKELQVKKSQIDKATCARILELEGSWENVDEEDAALDPVITAHCDELVALARSIVETEYAIEGFAKTKALFDKWLKVHIYLTALLLAMISVHVLSAVYYGLRWLP